MALAPPDFETLVRDNARLLAAAVRRVCGRRHQDLVPDVEQEVRLALWKRLQPRADGSLGNAISHPASYVYKVALSTALAVIRKQGASALGLDDPGVPEPVAEPPFAPAGDLQPAERRRLLAELLAGLEPDDARALRAWLAGCNHVEVARLFGWSESVARHRIYRTLERLRASPGDAGQADPVAGGGKR